MVHQVLGVNKILLTVNDKFFHTLTQCCCQAVVPKKLRQSWLLRIIAWLLRIIARTATVVVDIFCYGMQTIL